MPKIYLMGECMIELVRTAPSAIQQSFAGDVYNTAVYLKRMFNNIPTSLITAVGVDQFSDDMVDSFSIEHIETNLVFRHQDKIPGIYAIQTDDAGERSFNYWRENSAARSIMQHIDENVVAKFDTGDVFFFSGISLAVILPHDRPKFWRFVEKLKAKGVQIVFDPNYRPRLWPDKITTKDVFDMAFVLADIALPGVEDFKQLYGFDDSKQIQSFCKNFALTELIIKNGEGSVLIVNQDSLESFAISPVSNVVDTTSAGDSFNGVYLGARMNNATIKDAVKIAATTAGFVIQHQGAIVPKPIFDNFIEQQLIT